MHPDRFTLITTLKKNLKKRGITYKVLSQKSGISFSVLKKIMAGQDLSLDKFCKICDSLDINFFDLVQIAKKNRNAQVNTYTKKQEDYFMKRPLAYLIFNSLYRDKFNYEQTRERFSVSKKKYIKIIKELETIDLLELHPNNKIKFLVEGAIKTDVKSPMYNKFINPMAKNFFNFTRIPEELRKEFDLYFCFATGHMSEETFKEFKADLSMVNEKVVNNAMMDKKLIPIEKLIPVSWIITNSNYDSFASLSKNFK